MAEPESGFALAAAVLVTIVLMSFGLLLLGAERDLTSGSDLQWRKLQATEIAEAGIEEALMEIRRAEDLDAEPGIGNVAGQVGGGSYSAELVSEVSGKFLIECVAEFRGVTRRVDLAVEAEYSTPVPAAITSLDMALVSGAWVLDRFDSRLGTYASQVVGDHAMFGGHILANGMAMLNVSDVYGDVLVAPGQTVRGAAVVHGTRGNLDEPLSVVTPPLAEFEAALAANDNDSIPTGILGAFYNDATKILGLTGAADLTLPAGTYFFTRILMSGDSRLRTSGKVRIYVTESMSASGSSIYNPDGPPTDMTIVANRYVLAGLPPPSSSPRAGFSGSSGGSFLFYGPGFDVVASGFGEFYGAIIANRVALNGPAIHHDVAITEGYSGGGEVTAFTRKYWSQGAR